MHGEGPASGLQAWPPVEKRLHNRAILNPKLEILRPKSLSGKPYLVGVTLAAVEHGHSAVRIGAAVVDREGTGTDDRHLDNA